jgi:preprotein translocase subunit SecA
MMKQMGMKEDSMIEHKMISSSIENAQEKIEKKVLTENAANSQQEWIERNLPA